MSIVSRLAGWFKRDTSTSENPSSWFVDWMRGGQKAASGVVVSQMRALHEVTCMSCVSIRAGDLAKTPCHVYRLTPDGGQAIVQNHPLERLLRKPNAWQTRMEFVETMQAALLMHGDAYAAIGRDGRATPVSLIPMSDVCIESTDDGDLFYRWRASNRHEAAVLASFPNPIPAANVLHLRWLSLNGLRGLSRLSLAREAIGLSLALEEHSARLFSNGARPGGVLETEKRLPDDVFARFSATWANFTGVENSGKTPILEEGLKWKPLAMTSVESQTIDARRLQIEQIATAFDVPMHRLGIIPDGGATAIIQAHQMYLNNTLSTDAERWESKMGDVFGLPDDMFVEFDLDYFNRADIQTRMNAYRTGIVGMVLKPNEARNKEGYGKVDGGDKVYQPTNVAPLGFEPKGSETGPGSDVTGAPAPGGDGDPAAVQPVN